MILYGLGTTFHVDLGIFRTQTCYLTCLVASLWRLGGPWGDLGTLESTTKDIVRSRLAFVLIVGGLRDLILRHFFGTLYQTMCVLLRLLFPGSFSNEFCV